MQKGALYGIIAAAVVAAGVGIAFASMSMNNTAEPVVANEQPGNDVRVIKHVMGETEITGTPERVVTLYSVFTGDVRALGVQPAATVDKDWINGWLTPIGLPLSENVADVGIPDEPNLEVILQLEPDLIIGHGGVWGSHDEMYEELSSIAPTVILDDAPAESGLDELEVGKQNFMAIADALNRHDEGAAYLQKIESQYDEAAQKIEQAGMKGTKFVLAQAYLSSDVPGAYVFTENSFSTKVLNNIGLVNEIPDPADTSDKWYQTGMEGLTTIDKPDTHLIVTYNAGQYESNPLERSPVWGNLGFVKEGRAHDIGNTRVFGQVIFIEEIVNRVVDALTGNSSETRTISHDMGETAITGTPERIVTMSQVAYGILLELGVQPVGADLWQKGSPQNPEDPVYWEQYFPGIAEEWPGVVNVGNSGEPNLEVIASLEPDLILDSDWALGKNYDDLNAIAPTIAYFRNAELASGVTPLDQLERHTMGIADALGRHDEGVAMVERMNANYAEEKAKLEEAGLAGEKFLFLQTFAADSIFALTPDSRQSYTIEALGLENALPGEEFVEGGRIAIGLEQLAELDSPDLHVIYIYYGQDPVPTLEGNPVWDQLSFVRDGRIYTVGTPPPEPAVDIWGGPQTTIQFVDKVVEVMTSSAGTRTVSHAAGTTEITGTPQRIIPLDTVSVELLLALGIEPVGLASVEDHKTWSPEIATEWPNVADVGETWEPNFEVMAQLEPDLIIGMQAAHSEMYDDLSSIAPTILLDNWPEEGGPTMLEAVEQNTMLVADVLGRHDDGAAFLEGFNAKLDQNAGNLEAAGLDGAKIILADVWVNEGTPTLRLYVPNAQGSETLERMGLENVVAPPAEFERFGSIDSTLEGLAALDGPGVHFLYLLVPGEDPFTSSEYWADNPVWNDLSFVEEGRVYSLGSINMFRGVLMLEKLADKATEQLTK
jgi:ABC-type Fe3+-hydroxamate transport system substrate-binding protein